MQRTYILGDDNDTIALNVKIGTKAIANTVVAQHRSGGQKAIIAQSNVDSGHIDKPIGPASQFKDSVLVIVTLLNVLDPANDFDEILDRLFTRYTLSGGFSGTQVFNHDIDDVIVNPNKTMIMISKAIKFI